MALVPTKHRGGTMTRSQNVQSPMDLIRRQMGALIENFLGGLPTTGDDALQSFWGFDVQENDKEVVVRAEMPGFEEDKIDVTLHNDVLTIQAEKEDESDGGRAYRNYYRSVTLPPGIDVERAQATYRNGVLELHLPRRPGSSGQRIPLQGEGQQKPTSTAAAAQAGGTRPARGNGSGGGQQTAQTANEPQTVGAGQGRK